MLLSSGSPVDGVGYGDSSPRPYDTAAYSPRTGIITQVTQLAYAEIYRRQVWPYVLVRKLGVGVGRLPLKVFTRDDRAGRLEARETPYADLLRKPNPAMGRKFLWQWTSSTYELYGESMWLKLRDDRRRVRELWPMHPVNIDVRRGPSGKLWYLYVGAGANQFNELIGWPASEVVHFKGFNPDNLVRGLSPCEPLRETLASEDAARRGQAALWRNGARPSMALSTDKSLSDKAFARLEAQWATKHGGVDNWAKTPLLEEGLKPIPVQVTPEDMQYVEGRRLSREECCATWDVPPPAVHILDRATFSNITEQMRSLYRETMGGRLPFHEDTLASQLAIDFGYHDGETYAEFMLDEVLRGAHEVRIPANAQEIGTGQSTINEIRRRENKPDLPGGDELLVNAALVPVAALTVYEQAAVDELAGADKPEGLTARAVGTLVGRLSRAATVHDVQDEHLLAGLDDTAAFQIRGLLNAARLKDLPITTLRRQIAASVTIPSTASSEETDHV